MTRLTLVLAAVPPEAVLLVVAAHHRLKPLARLRRRAMTLIVSNMIRRVLS
jgi:hypothetical protein